MQKLLEQLAATAELMDHQLTPIALSVMGKDLKNYPEDVVIQALQNLRNEKGRFTQAGIVSEIEKLRPDGRPSADEAWAMIPRDEHASAMLTNEMQGALRIAQALLDEGDPIGARMSFIRAYDRLVAENKRAGIAAKWNVSLGWDVQGREPVLAEAIRLGRIDARHATTLLPPERVVPLLEAAGQTALVLEFKPPSDEVAQRNIARMKEIVAGSRIGKTARIGKTV